MGQYCFGVDVGGTTIKLGLFNKTGEVVDKWEIVTRTENKGEQILPDIAVSIKAKMQEKSIAKEDVIGVGLGVPGPVNSKGEVFCCVNLGWEQFNINEKLNELIDIPVRGGNDANVAALGEMWKGGGQGYQNLVVVTLGTGVGSGIIIDGKLLTGAKGGGGEIGHIHIMDDETEACGCGNYGCLEEYASATGIVRLAKRKLSITSKESNLNPDTLTAKDLWDAVKVGDAVAVDVAKEFGEYLGKGLAGVAGVVDPEVFVIGGGVSKAGEILFKYIVEPYQKYVFHGSKDVEFRLATLGNDAGIYGAAKLALE